MNAFTRQACLLLGLVFFSTLFLSVTPPKAHAANRQGTWVKVDTITANNGTDDDVKFIDGSPYDDTVEFLSSKANDKGCKDKINGFGNSGDMVNDNGDVQGSADDATVDYVVMKPGGGGCVEDKKVDIDLNKRAKRQATFEQGSVKLIVATVNQPQGDIKKGTTFVKMKLLNDKDKLDYLRQVDYFKNKDEDKIFFRQSEGKICTDFIELGAPVADNVSRAKLVEHTNDADETLVGDDRRQNSPVDGCFLTNGVGSAQEDGTVVNVWVDTTNDTAPADKYQSASGTVPADPNAASGGDSCESHNKTVLIGWLVCGVINAIDETMQSTDKVVDELLSVKPEVYQTDQLKAVWSAVKNIATFLLIAVGLFMIISQAIGSGPFDAYSVKKILPRLVAAVILIQLSWYLFTGMIQIVNVIGWGIQGIMYAPFGGSDAFTLNELLSDLGGGSGFFAAAAVGGGVAAIGLFGLFSLAITVAFALLVGFFTLVLRQIVIIVLLVLSPLALAAWILPNTEKFWKMWWESFSKLLLMYPMILALLAGGKLIAYIATTGSISGGGALQTVIVILAIFLPYFLIPKTFQLAGAAFGAVSGGVNRASQGGFKALKGYRGKKLQENVAATMAGKRFKGGTDSNFRGRLNRGLQRAGHANKAGFNPLNWQAKTAAAVSSTNMINRDKMMSNDEEYTWKGDDDLNRMAAETNNADQMRARILNDPNMMKRYAGPHDKNLERDIMRVENMRRKYGNDAFRQATYLQAVAGGTAYKGAGEVWAGAAAVAGDDNAVLYDLVAKGRSVAMNSGRVDQGGAGFNETVSIAKAFRDNPQYTVGQANTDMARLVLKSQGAGVLAHSSMKPQAIDNLTPQINEQLDAAFASGDELQIDNALANVANIHDALTSSSPQLADRFARDVFGRELNVGSLSDGARGALNTAINQGGGVRQIQSVDDQGNLSVTYEEVPQFSNNVINIKQAIDSRRASNTFQIKRRELTAEQQADAASRGAVGTGTGGLPGPGLKP